MRVLLDTHVFLWLQTTPERVGSHLVVLENPDTDLVVSAASAWEIAIKYRLGKLDLPEDPARYVPDRVRRIRGTPLAIEHHHALATAELPPIHRDPFDRLLLAQAHRENLPLLTADTIVHSYPVDTRLIDDRHIEP